MTQCYKPKAVECVEKLKAIIKRKEEKKIEIVVDSEREN